MIDPGTGVNILSRLSTWYQKNRILLVLSVNFVDMRWNHADTYRIRKIIPSQIIGRPIQKAARRGKRGCLAAQLDHAPPKCAVNRKRVMRRYPDRLSSAWRDML